MKRIMSLFCACLLLILPLTQNAAAAYRPSYSTEQSSLEYHDTFVIDDGSIDGYVVKVDVKNGIIQTRHIEEDGTITIMATDLATNIMTTQTVRAGKIISEKSELSPVSLNAFAIQNTSDYIWNKNYTNIGSVTYKANGYTGEELKLNIQAKEQGNFSNCKMQLNESQGKALQFLVQQLIEWVMNLGAASVLVVDVIVDSLIATAVIVVVNGVITAIASPTIMATGMNYDVKATDPFGNRSVEVEGTFMKCTAGSRLNETFSSGYYPQFLKNKDESTASDFFVLFRDMGYNGVKTYNATVTVPYK
ncbi:hypothetical protein [uncultured Dysosmobacter sp.]|uniref:hypothetical protein n=1 Tax=uncultured Dysosmobacter sp. TaxID=2591384 RepID=UPI00263319EF|nr:hypothetical protein [uncultured Dysosmobacter sp.]